MSGKNDGGAVKKPIYKKWWFWVIIVFIALGALNPKKGTTKKTMGTSNEATVSPVSSPAPVESAAPIVSDDVDAKKAAQESLKAALSSGSVSFHSSVRNDVTGRWRLLIYHSGKDILPHAIDYYRAFFSADNEVHFVVNLGLKTTTVLRVGSGSLYATVHEYVKGEEHNAKALADGIVLADYIVNLSSGEIEKVAK